MYGVNNGAGSRAGSRAGSSATERASQGDNPPPANRRRGVNQARAHPPMMAAGAHGRGEALRDHVEAYMRRSDARGGGGEDPQVLRTPEHRFGATRASRPAMGSVSSGGNPQGYQADSPSETLLSARSNASLQRANPRSPASCAAPYISSRHQDAAQGRAVPVPSPVDDATHYSVPPAMAPRGQERGFWVSPVQTPQSNAATYGGSSSGAGSAAGRSERNSPQFQGSPPAHFHVPNQASSVPWGVGSHYLEDESDTSSSDEGKRVGTE